MRAFAVSSPKCRRDFFDCHSLMLMAYRMYGHPQHFDYLLHLLSISTLPIPPPSNLSLSA